MRLGHLLHAHVERCGLGVVLVEAGYILRRRPDTVRGPDISFVASTRMAPDQVPEAFIAGAPDLAVEILSPDDRSPDLEGKVADYFEAGARLVWIVEPRRRRIEIRAPHRATRVASLGDTLDGEDVVPAFSCSVAEVFGV
jgi:Uma2 family endonuclease